jgi:nitroreductase
MDAIKGRRSIRRFTDQGLTDQETRTLLEAVRWTPSWANTQVWEVVLVQDQDQRRELAETMKMNPGARAVLEAPLVAAMAGRLKVSGCLQGSPMTDKGDWYMFDLGLATQNLCLAAHDLGLGTVIIGFFDAARVRRIIGLPGEMEIAVLVPVGHPAREGRTPPRREIEEFTHYDRF